MYIGVHGRPKPAAARNKERGVVMDVGTSAGAGVTKGGGEGANVLDPNMFFPWLTVPE